MAQYFYTRNIEQAALMQCELKGQFSDGFWERCSNRKTDWAPWSEAVCKVAEEGQPLGRTFDTTKDNYMINNKELLEVVGDRMILYVRLARAGVNLEDIRDVEYLFTGSRKNFVQKRDEILKPWNSTSAFWLARKHAFWLAKKEKCEAYLESIPNIVDTVVNDVYGIKDLKADLKDMRKFMKNKI